MALVQVAVDKYKTVFFRLVQALKRFAEIAFDEFEFFCVFSTDIRKHLGLSRV